MPLSPQEESVLIRKIIQFMGENDCTQEEFANLCSLSRTTINKFINRNLKGKGLSKLSLSKIVMTLNEGNKYFKVIY